MGFLDTFKHYALTQNMSSSFREKSRGCIFAFTTVTHFSNEATSLVRGNYRTQCCMRCNAMPFLCYHSALTFDRLAELVFQTSCWRTKAVLLEETPFHTGKTVSRKAEISWKCDERRPLTQGDKVPNSQPFFRGYVSAAFILSPRCTSCHLSSSHKRGSVVLFHVSTARPSRRRNAHDKNHHAVIFPLRIVSKHHPICSLAHHPTHMKRMLHAFLALVML